MRHAAPPLTWARFLPDAPPHEAARWTENYFAAEREDCRYPEKVADNLLMEDREVLRDARRLAKWWEGYRVAEVEGKEPVRLLPAPQWMHRLASAAARDLGVSSPELRLFRACRTGERADHREEADVMGWVYPKDAAYPRMRIRAGRTPRETALTLLHETAHVWESRRGLDACEDRCDAWAATALPFYTALVPTS